VIDAVSLVDARPAPVASRHDIAASRRRSTASPSGIANHASSRSFTVSELRISAETRTEFGKGGARRTRRAGKIPAVIYGHGEDPRHVSLPAREFTNAIRHGGANVLLTLDVDGGEQLAIPKAIQRHPIKGIFEHIDLLAVRRGEKVTIDVPLHVTGEVAPGGLLAQEATTVAVEAEATNLPTGIEISVEGREVGSQILARDLELSAGSTLIGDPEQVLLIVQEAPTAEEVEADMAEAADEMGIVEDQPQEPEGAESTDNAESEGSGE
jgi:large subunit ribosomal protein L25